MNYIKICLIIGLLIGNSCFLSASTGCLINSNQVFTNKVNPGLLNSLLGATPIYQNNASVVTSAECVNSTIGSCRVCLGTYTSFLGLITGCQVGFTYGYEVNYVVNCSLESNSFIAFLFGSAIMAMLSIRKNK